MKIFLLLCLSMFVVGFVLYWAPNVYHYYVGVLREGDFRQIAGEIAVLGFIGLFLGIFVWGTYLAYKSLKEAYK